MATSTHFLGAVYEKSIHFFLHTKAKAVFKKAQKERERVSSRHWESKKTCYWQAGHFRLLNSRQERQRKFGPRKSPGFRLCK